LSEFQLDWLEKKLIASPERHTLLLLHHHPLPSGCSWLDQHSLRNAAELDNVLARFHMFATCYAGIFTRSWTSTGMAAAC
jgi:Icc protein